MPCVAADVRWRHGRCRSCRVGRPCSRHFPVRTQTYTPDVDVRTFSEQEGAGARNISICRCLSHIHLSAVAVISSGVQRQQYPYYAFASLHHRTSTPWRRSSPAVLRFKFALCGHWCFCWVPLDRKVWCGCERGAGAVHWICSGGCRGRLRLSKLESGCVAASTVFLSFSELLDLHRVVRATVSKNTCYWQQLIRVCLIVWWCGQVNFSVFSWPNFRTIPPINLPST